MKRLVMAFGLGVLAPLFFAVWLGGENLAQVGMRLAAIEGGFRLAARHWQWEATPEHDPELVAHAEPVPAAKPKKGRR